MRAFLAVDLPVGVRAAIAALQNRLGPQMPGWRWVRPESIHLTLRFLGDVPDDIASTGGHGWAQAARAVRTFGIVARGLGCFPAAQRPRVLWIGIQEIDGPGCLASLAAAFERGAQELGFAPEPRPFQPHLTLARAERGVRTLPVARPDAEIAEPIPVTHAVLFQSELLPSGARYTALGRFPLGAAPGLG